MITIKRTTADGAWRAAAARFQDDGSAAHQESRAGSTRELLHVGFEISNPRERWVLSREPALNPAFALAEVIWIVSGRNDSAFLNFWNRRLPKYAGKGPRYHGAYGHRMRRRFGIDQIKRAYQALASNPDSRQVVLQIWGSKLDLPSTNGAPAAADVPCNICSMIKVRAGRLEWVQVMRSNDLVLGLPHNIVQFTYLQEMFAGWLGLDVGTYTHLSDSLHVYKDDVGSITPSTRSRWPKNTDRWDLTYPETVKCVSEMAARIDRIRRSKARAPMMNVGGLPRCAENMMRVISADALRRRKRYDAIAEIIDGCTNPALAEAWSRWSLRKERLIM